MDKPELDHEHMAHSIRDKKLGAALFFFFLLIPLPAILVGHWQIAAVALLISFIYIFMNPELMMPSKAELDLLIRSGQIPVVQRPAGQMTPKPVLNERAGQTAQPRDAETVVGNKKS